MELLGYASFKRFNVTMRYREAGCANDLRNRQPTLVTFLRNRVQTLVAVLRNRVQQPAATGNRPWLRFCVN